MKFTKFGHSCLLIEEGSARILFDPGSYSAGFEGLQQLDVILITHVHGDHCDTERLKSLIDANPGVRVLTNPQVQGVLESKGIAAEVLAEGSQVDVKGIRVQAFGTIHAEIYKTVPRDQNVGFMVGGRFFYPGDAFTVPPVAVEILGAPLAGPWMKISEGIDYVQAVMPKVAIPMHDGILKQPGMSARIAGGIIESFGVKMLLLEDSSPAEL